MSTRSTIVTVFILGLVCGVLIALMWVDRNTPPDETTREYWKRPMATKRSA